MKVYIAGTPLDMMLWKRLLGKVRIVFRPDTDVADKMEFLEDLIVSAFVDLETYRKEAGK